MPDFEFTSPEGKKYKVAAPPGGTKEQAFAVLQRHLGPQGGTQAPPPPPAPSGDSKSPFKDIFSSAGIGAALGAASPEIMRGLGTAAELGGAVFPPAAPVLEPAGAALQAAGTLAGATKSARALATLNGAIGGGASETAGQIAEGLGAPAPVSFASRLVAGALTPEVGDSLIHLGSSTLSKGYHLLKSAASKGEDALANSAAVRRAMDALRGSPLSHAPQETVHAAIAHGLDAEKADALLAANEIRKQAEERANELRARSPEIARKVISEADTKAKQILDAADTRSANIADLMHAMQKRSERISSGSAQDLAQVGQKKELSDIGESLRTRISSEQNAALKARTEQYMQDKVARDALVNEKEKTGELISQTSGYQKLIREVKGKLLRTPTSRKRGITDVPSGAAAAAWEKILYALNGRTVAVGKTPNGDPIYKKFPNSFEAVDWLRRQFGDAAKFGQDVEGFSALGVNEARSLYDKLSEIQIKYAGGQKGPQAAMQENYAAASGEYGRRFRTTPGIKATAVDRFDSERYKTDAAAIPSDYFKSLSSVNDLIKLTGDKKLVQGAASSYVAKILDGKTPSAAKSWLSDPHTTDWIRAFPGLQKQAIRYAAQLSKREAITNRASKAVSELAKRRGGALSEADAEAAKLHEEALKEAKARTLSTEETAVARAQEGSKQALSITDAAQKRASDILKGNTPDIEITRLLTGSDPVSDIRSVAGILGKSEEGKAALVGAVRQVLSRQSPKKLDEIWNTRLRSALHSSGLVPASEITKLDSDIKNVMSKYHSDPVKGLGFARRILINAVNSYAASVSARTLTGDIMGSKAAQQPRRWK